jgi:hypothetical protein
VSNLIVQVEEVQDYLRREMPEGGEWVIRRVPMLLRRIEELERALIPFARQSAREKQFKTKVPLTQVYIKDCDHAMTVLSRAASLAALPAPTEIAAE